MNRLKGLISILVLNREPTADKWFSLLQVLHGGGPWPHSFPLDFWKCIEGYSVARDVALCIQNGVGGPEEYGNEILKFEQKEISGNLALRTQARVSERA